IVMFGAAGLMSSPSFGRAVEPAFTHKGGGRTPIWPGATAAGTPGHVSDPIGQTLHEVAYFGQDASINKPTLTAMLSAVKHHTPSRDVPQLFYQSRKKIGDLKDTLPPALIGPTVNDEYGDVDSILYMLTADGADYAQMKKVAEALRQRLLKVKN